MCILYYTGGTECVSGQGEDMRGSAGRQAFGTVFILRLLSSSFFFFPFLLLFYGSDIRARRASEGDL